MCVSHLGSFNWTLIKEILAWIALNIEKKKVNSSRDKNAEKLNGFAKYPKSAFGS